MGFRIDVVLILLLAPGVTHRLGELFDTVGRGQNLPNARSRIFLIAFNGMYEFTDLEGQTETTDHNSGHCEMFEI